MNNSSTETNFDESNINREDTGRFGVKTTLRPDSALDADSGAVSKLESLREEVDIMWPTLIKATEYARANSDNVEQLDQAERTWENLSVFRNELSVRLIHEEALREFPDAATVEFTFDQTAPGDKINLLSVTDADNEIVYLADEDNGSKGANIIKAAHTIDDTFSIDVSIRGCQGFERTEAGYRLALRNEFPEPNLVDLAASLPDRRLNGGPGVPDLTLPPLT